MSKDKKGVQLGFAENFALSGAAAVISKTAAAPIERVKLMVQNQDEMLKSGRLKEPYKGVIDCTMRTYRTEGAYMYSGSSVPVCSVGCLLEVVRVGCIFFPIIHFEQKGNLENTCAYTSCGSVFVFDCIVKKRRSGC